MDMEEKQKGEGRPGEIWGRDRSRRGAKRGYTEKEEQEEKEEEQEEKESET